MVLARSPRDLSDCIAPLAEISVATPAQPAIAALTADALLGFQARFTPPHSGFLRQSWFVLVLGLKNWCEITAPLSGADWCVRVGVVMTRSRVGVEVCSQHFFRLEWSF